MGLKKSIGQYFTTSSMLQQFVFDKVKFKSAPLLEPSFGAGHLLLKFKEYDDDYPMVCYELDSTITPTVDFNSNQTVIYGDFTKQTIVTKFKTIIGNPPYVKQSGGNLYLKFVEQCYDCLTYDGELIFIVPSDFIKLTSASRLITKMVANGSFTDFLFPHDENLFDDASIDVMVFRYQKGVVCKKVTVNGDRVFWNFSRGIITFGETKATGVTLDSMFDVYVGLVSGRDKIYRTPIGNIDVLVAEGRVERFIFLETFPSDDPKINKHLLKHKQELLDRKIKKFSEKNWFEWGAPRNISAMRRRWDERCIYVKNLTRNDTVAFAGDVQYFGGALLCLIPKIEMTEDQLQTTVEHINSTQFKKDYTQAGRFKIGHKQLSSAIAPFQL